jgi:alpha/beta superfamily hydrolase
MDNKVIYRVARALEDAGGLVLRYNFRGAGGSEGRHDEGRGEQDDLRAAVSFLRQESRSELPLVLAGFSFGSVISALVAPTLGDVSGLLFVGAPRRLYELEEPASYGGPLAFIHGDVDEHGPLDEFQSFFEGLPEPKTLKLIEGAGHFFEQQQAELAAAVAELVEDGRLGVSRTSAPEAP